MPTAWLVSYLFVVCLFSRALPLSSLESSSSPDPPTLLQQSCTLMAHSISSLHIRWLSDEPFVMHSFGCCASMSCLNLGVCAGVTLIKHPMSRHLAFCRSMLSPGVKEALVDLSILHARWHAI